MLHPKLNAGAIDLYAHYTFGTGTPVGAGGNIFGTTPDASLTTTMPLTFVGNVVSFPPMLGEGQFLFTFSYLGTSTASCVAPSFGASNC